MGSSKKYLFWTNYNSESTGIKTSENPYWPMCIIWISRAINKRSAGAILGGCVYAHIYIVKEAQLIYHLISLVSWMDKLYIYIGTCALMISSSKHGYLKENKGSV